MLKFIGLLLIILFSPLASALSYTLEVSEQEVQQRVAEKMPLEKKWLAFKIILSNPHVDLIKGTKQVGLQVDVAVSGPGHLNGNGQAQASGELQYQADKAEFHLLDPKIISLHIDKVSADMQATIQAVAQTALSKALASLPIYRLKDDKLKDKLAKAVLESIEVKNERFLLHLKL